jgi:hypothetical protein
MEALYGKLWEMGSLPNLHMETNIGIVSAFCCEAFLDIQDKNYYKSKANKQSILLKIIHDSRKEFYA